MGGKSNIGRVTYKSIKYGSKEKVFGTSPRKISIW